MKKLVIITFLLLSICSQSQTYIKGNAITALALVPNVGIETSIGKKSTFQFDIMASFWSSIDGRPREFYTLTSEYRYHFHKKNEGIYIGGHIGASFFNVQKLDKINTDFYEVGLGYFIGATIGYEKKLNDRFMLDIFLGGGNHQAFYKDYSLTTGERVDKAKDYNKSGEWFPYRGGVMVSYRIN